MLSSLEDFMADPTNPNVDGLLENVKGFYKAVIDQYGNGIFITYYLDCRSIYLLQQNAPYMLAVQKWI